MSCDFSTYNQLRDVTRNASVDAKSACDSLTVAEQAVADAQAALAAAQQAKQSAYRAWEDAEKAENAEAERLGINPTPEPVL